MKTRLPRDIRPKRAAEKRGRRIDRHLMCRGCCGKVSQIASGHTNDDIRRCGGPIGSKRRQERRSRGFFHGFARFLGARRPICCRVFESCRGPRRSRWGLLFGAHTALRHGFY